MFPTLFDSAWVGLTGDLRFTISTYFVMLLSGFLGAAWLAGREAVRMGISQQRYIDFATWMLIVGILGSRFMHVLVDGFLTDYVNLCVDPLAMQGRSLPSLQACISNAQCLVAQSGGADLGGICNPEDGLCYPQPDCLRPLKFWAGGLTVYGALLACAAFGAYYTRKHKMGVARMMDLGGYGIFFGTFLGRLGCLGAGCCYGALCALEKVGMRFPQGSLAYAHHYDEHLGMLQAQWTAGIKGSLAVWPTQVMDASYNLIIFVLMYFVVRPRKRFHGQVMLTGAICYGISRFMIEFVRDDFRGGALGLSTSQLVSIPLVLACLFFLIKKLRSVDAVSTTLPPADSGPGEQDATPA
jgi:phosphatidylglycerol---prolipoprotein diacylglyceryl transferase